MALSNIQADVLRLLAAHRDVESDIDIFQDRAERVAQAALNDASVLRAAG